MLIIHNTYKYLFIPLCLMLSLTISAQEICDNGIDDDGDALVDLNDEDCVCNNAYPLTDIHGHACTRIDLTLDVPDALSYQWYKDGVALTNETDKEIEIHKFYPLGDGSYQVIAQTANGCVSSIPYHNVAPVFSTDLGEEIICEGDTIIIDGFPFFVEGRHQYKTTTTEGCDSLVSCDIVVVNCSPYGHLYGKVFIDANSNGMLDLEENVLDNVEVTVDGPISSSLDTGLGRYSYQFEEPGAYELEIDVPSGFELSDENALSFAVDAPRIYNIDIALEDARIPLPAVPQTYTHDDLLLYPNPSSSHITAKSASKVTEMSLFSLDGALISTTSSSIMNTADLSIGIYLMSVKTEDNRYTRKVEIVR